MSIKQFKNVIVLGPKYSGKTYCINEAILSGPFKNNYQKVYVNSLDVKKCNNQRGRSNVLGQVDYDFYDLYSAIYIKQEQFALIED